MKGLAVLRRVGIAVLLALIVIRPDFGTTAVETTSARQVAIVLVVDRTKSMDALDVDEGPRFDRLRTDLIELVRSLPEASFALISFATEATVELPLTSDLAIVEQRLAALDLESPLRADGSRLDRPLEKVVGLMQQTIAQTPDGLVRIVLAGDGENTESGSQASYAPVRRLISDGVVLGYGTEDGGRMTIAGGTDLSQGYIPVGGSDRPAISRFDPRNLRTVADELGVPFVHRDRAGGIDAVATRIGEDTVEGSALSGRELTWLFAMLLLILALIELRASWRGLLSTARDRVRS
ncbi:VWA domain-containing protein [Nocardioides sp.]|uniref:vWA domain-containing protein n=1 Tax=Nocardioides sp. TaxID=35761 RepID=UPI002B2690D7|nr:VWA domain-containing protein [Nocardioides sp.]